MANTKVTTRVIADDAITSDKLASGLTLGGVTTFAGAVSFGDNNITNVGSIALDILKGDADDNTNITFAGSDTITVNPAGTQRLSVNTNGISVTGTATATTFSGALSGTIASATTATTQSASDNTTKVATTAYVTTAVSNLVDSSPAALNTLNELAAALGDNENYATETATLIGTKLPLAGGTLTGPLVVDTDTEHQIKIDASSASGASMHINSAGGYAYTVYQNTNATWRTGAYGGTNYIIRNHSTGLDEFTLTSAGYLGLGGSPTYPLDVTTASGHSYIRTISTASNTRAALLTTGEDSSGNAVNGYFGSVGDANEIEIASLTNHQIKMYVNNTPAKGVIINTDGNFLPQQDVEILDNKKLKVGSGGDLQIYHDASNSYIKSSTGWLNMPTGGNGVSIANSDFSEQIARFLLNGACELYYNGEKTLETTATGINVFDTGGTPYIDLKTGSTLQGRIYADTNQMIIDANNSTTIQMKHAGVMQAAFNTNVNSSGDGGLAITSGKRLGFDESGTRSWTVKATGGNLQVFSGDGGGSFYISMSTYLANTLQQALPSTGLAHTQAGWGRTFYMSMDWSSVARTLTLHTNSSYFQAKVTVATQQSNGGSDNNRWVEGIWSNNHTTHLWKEFVDEGFTGQNETYTVGVGDSASNSGKLVIARAYQANASGTFRVKVENVGYVGSMTYAIT